MSAGYYTDGVPADERGGTFHTGFILHQEGCPIPNDEANRLPYWLGCPSCDGDSIHVAAEHEAPEGRITEDGIRRGSTAAVKFVRDALPGYLEARRQLDAVLDDDEDDDA